MPDARMPIRQLWPANRFRVESPPPIFPQATLFPRSPVFFLAEVATLRQSALFPFRSLHSGFLCLRPFRSLLLLLLRPLLESPSFPSPFLAARPFSFLRFFFTPFIISFVPGSTLLDPNRLDSFAFFPPSSSYSRSRRPPSHPLDGPYSSTNNPKPLLLRDPRLPGHLISNRLASHSWLLLFSCRFPFSSSLHP